MSFCESDEEAEWLAVLFCITRRAGTLLERSIRRNIYQHSPDRRREWRARGSVAAGSESKSPHQQQIRRPRQSEIESYAVPRGRRTKEDPAARPSGRKVLRSAKDLEEDAVLACRADPASERIQSPQQDLRAAQEFSHPWTLPRI